ncbi:hypothetical protein EDC01DRAFT_216384 [Geopyxis carbonaria]|nr:hypothetical protein EDC01DRAFT_216384 [Geopyxis carbonaria]
MPTPFVYRQLFVRPTAIPRDIDLSGKTVLITGASGGLGMECAKQLLERRVSRLILPIRKSVERGPEIRKKLLPSAADKDAAIDFFELDMERHESIVECVDAMKKAEITRLDIAILNAGVQPYNRYTTPSGTERTLQINYVSTCHLALLLLPFLAATKSGLPGRLTVVGSETHYMATLKERNEASIITALDTIPKEKYSGLMQYHNSKLLLHLFLLELAAKVPASSVVINSVNPGLANTKLGRDMSTMVFCAAYFAILILGRKASIAARTLTHAAIVVDESSHGGFFSECQPFPYSPLVTSDEGAVIQKKLWMETMERLRVADPQVDEALRIAGPQMEEI